MKTDVARAIGLALLAALLPGSAAGQDWPSSAPFGRIAEIGKPALHVFTDQDGLPQNAITTICLDQEGLLWVGTKDGAARFNGRTWRVVDVTPHVTSNWVQAILPARDGSLWFGTIGGGVARLAGGVWTRFDQASGLPDDDVYALAETVSKERGSTIWVGTRRGLASFEGGRWVRQEPAPGTRGAFAGTFEETSDPDGRRSLWVGLRAYGIARWRDGTWTFYGPESGLPESPHVAVLRQTRALGGGPVLVASVSGRLMRLDGERWSVFAVSDRQLPPQTHALADSVAADGTHTLWIATANGLFRYESGRLAPLLLRHGLPHMNVWSLLSVESPGGTSTVWAGTAGAGLVRLEQGLFTGFDTASGLPNKSVYALLESGAGEDRTFWFGTNTGGLARYEAGRFTVYNTDLGVPIIGSAISALAATVAGDGTETIWVGTASAGLFSFSKNVWHWYRQTGLHRLKGQEWVLADETQRMPTSRVFCFLPRKEADGSSVLWVGMEGGGLVRLVNGRVSELPAFALPDDRVRTLLTTTSRGGVETLWIGTERGLARVEGGRTIVLDTRNGLPNSAVSSLLEVRRGEGRRDLWVGTHGGGLAILDLDDPDGGIRVARPPAYPELPNKTVYQIRQDSRGRVYLFTNKGIARWTPRRPAPGEAGFDSYVFTTEDGLPSNECNTGASLVDSLGRIWAGTIGGAAMLDPRREVPDTVPRPLRLEKASLAGSERRLSSDQPLAHDENHLVFEYALASFFRTDLTRYSTQLVGFDPEPSAWSAETKKEYTSLPRGTYRFTVRGRDARGIVSGPVSLGFSIRTAPWLTWWAFTLYGAALVGVGYALVRFRLAAVRRRNVQLELRIEQRTAELSESEARAKVSEKEALEANRAKSVFLSSMSHELRTPLNAVLGFSQLMERDPGLTAGQRETLSVIQRAGQHLLGLINDVLSISKIEAGHVVLASAPFDLRALVRSVEEMLRVRVDAKAVTLSCEVSPDLPPAVLGDEGKVGQILINLLGNAVKFTEKGNVSLRAGWSRGRATFEIADTGPGIAPDELPLLFEPFVQTESGRKVKEGTGLGLALSRKLARLMEGDITVETERGRGTTFRVELGLPASLEDGVRAPVAEARRVLRLAPGQPAVRILAVDDLADNRLLLTRLLRSVGFEVEEAQSGEEAVASWRRFRPHLIWMDKRMPGMDGLEATRRIRIEEGLAPAQRTRILVLSASALDHERREILESGCDDFVAKPFREETIFAKIAEHLGVRYDRDEAAPAVEAHPPLDPARLARLPLPLRQALARAAEAGDFLAAERVAEEIRGHDPVLHEAVAGVIASFAFEDLLAALGDAGAQP